MDIPSPSDPPPVGYEPPQPGVPPAYDPMRDQPPPPLPSHLSPQTPQTPLAHSHFSPAKQLGLRALGVVIAIVVLHIVWRWLQSRGSELGDWPSYGEAWSTFKELRSDGFRGETLGGHLSATIGRVIFAMSIGVFVGGGLGVLFGSHPIVRHLSDPLVSFMRVLVPTVLLAVAVTFQGLGETSLRTAATIPVVFFVASSVSRLELRTSAFGRLMIERLVEVARAALLIAWITVTFSELVGSEAGVGAMTWSARSFLRTDIAVVALLVSALVVVAADYLIRLPLLFVPIKDGALCAPCAGPIR